MNVMLLKLANALNNNSNSN